MQRYNQQIPTPTTNYNTSTSTTTKILCHVTQKTITYHVRLLVVHAWATKDENGG